MRTFFIERKILVKVWIKENFTVNGKDLADAINTFHHTPEKEKYSKFKGNSECLLDTGTILETDINFNNCREIPTQGKLEI